MIKLDDVIEGMEFDFPETHYYYDKKTKTIVMVTDDDFSYADGDKDIDDADDWQEDSIRMAEELVEDPTEFISLPEKEEINEYGMMEDFVFSLKDKNNQKILFDAIEGRGAFRRFKDNVYFLGIELDWFAYRDEQYKKVAREWCENNQIEFIEQERLP